MNDAELKEIAGQPSWRLANGSAEAWVTRTGGQVGPVRLRVGEKWVEPLSVAPWATEADVAGPPVIRALRGDFFCMPFGGNETAFEGERHPVHGETANAAWTLVGMSRRGDETALALSLRTTIRPGRVDKTVVVMDGHPAIYSRHVISGASGPMGLGHHAMVKFNSPGLLATGRFVRGQVLSVPFEDPAKGGYQSLKTGARFDRLDQVPLGTGGVADLTRYPAREGFEDLVQIFADPALLFGWSAVSFPQEGYLWYALKDPKVLSGTVLWLSNGGRHYAPWSGRHRGVMGIEETTSYFHLGLAESAQENDATRQGLKTCLELDPTRPLVVNYIFGAVPIPPGFGAVETVERTDDSALFRSGDQSVAAPVRWNWLGE